MPEEFEDRDLAESVFWGVNLQRSLFRDTDLSGSTFFHVFMNDVSIDGEIDRLVVNGVDVTDYVNRHDRWWPLRNRLSPESVDALVDAWAALRSEWAALLERIASVDPTVADVSVNGEWSLTETLRHLIFAMDKWFVLPILGETLFSPIGLPNRSSQLGAWPGLERDAAPGFAVVLETRNAQHARFEAFISSLTMEALPDTVTVAEAGTVPTFMCFHVVLEEEFEHLRYMVRDLAALRM